MAMDERIVVGREMGPIAKILGDAIDESGGAEALGKQISKEQLASLRQRHVQLYERRLVSKHPAVNVLETQYLLNLWQGMEGKSFTELGEAERLEVLDAVVSG